MDNQLGFWHREADPKLPLPLIKAVPDAREALHHAQASVVASGTATVQALTIGNPFVVAFTASPRSPSPSSSDLSVYPSEIPATPDAEGNLPIAMPNLIAARRIVLNSSTSSTAQNLAGSPVRRPR